MTRMLTLLVCVSLLGCAEDGFTPGVPRTVDSDPEGPVTELLPGRSLSRLTARQLHASLEIATGQSWEGYEEVAATLGEPDFLQSTSEGLQISPAVERILEAAADQTCGDAVAADRLLATDDPGRAILAGVDLAAPTEAARTANLIRLILRFHGHEVSADDARLAPYGTLLDTPLVPTDVAPGATEADVEAWRWQAICTALALHPDFLSY